jgi:hypothetical protein
LPFRFLAELVHPSYPGALTSCFARRRRTGHGVSRDRSAISRGSSLRGSARSGSAGGLGDLPLVLELKLQLFNYLGQPLSRKGVCGLQGELRACSSFRSNTTRLMRFISVLHLPSRSAGRLASVRAWCGVFSIRRRSHLDAADSVCAASLVSATTPKSGDRSTHGSLLPQGLIAFAGQSLDCFEIDDQASVGIVSTA